MRGKGVHGGQHKPATQSQYNSSYLSILMFLFMWSSFTMAYIFGSICLLARPIRLDREPIPFFRQSEFYRKVGVRRVQKFRRLFTTANRWRR